MTPYKYLWLQTINLSTNYYPIITRVPPDQNENKMATGSHFELPHEGTCTFFAIGIVDVLMKNSAQKSAVGLTDIDNHFSYL